VRYFSENQLAPRCVTTPYLDDFSGKTPFSLPMQAACMPALSMILLLSPTL
jgi:hypothetical protein